MTSSHPDDYVSCLVSKRRKLYWKYHEVSFLMKLCDVSDRPPISTVVITCDLADGSSIKFVRTIASGAYAFAEAYFQLPLDQIMNHLGNCSKDAVTIFRTVDGSPAMMNARMLPEEIIAMIG